MASVRINVFQNFGAALDNCTVQQFGSDGNLHLHGIEMPGSLSFNNVGIFWSAGTNTNAPFSNSKSLTAIFGLYSLNGSTLSLANSASVAISVQGSTVMWLTMVTSATQDIVPGNWWLALASFRSGIQNQSLLIGGNVGAFLNDGAAGGVPIRGLYNSTTNAMPATIHTTAINKEGDGVSDGIANHRHPLIVITA